MVMDTRRAGTADADFFSQAQVNEIVRRLTEDLESRVRARTEDLKAANERLLREIDERRAAEKKLRESEELYRYTVELSQQIVWTAAPDGTLVSVGRRVSQITGVDPRASPQEAWLQVIHPEDSKQLYEAWKAARRDRVARTAEFRMRVADGSYRTFKARATPRFDEEGNLVRWYGFTEDVHDQKLAEEARREAEERYRLAAQATNDAIWDLDIAAKEIHWSESSSEALGYPGILLGTTSLDWWQERVHPEDRYPASESLMAAIRDGKTRWSASYRFRRANGDYGTVFDRGFIIRDAEGKGIRAVGAMADLTERHRAEQEVRRMQAELIHVSRLSAMGTMASTLAHELNQPLTAVTNYVRGAKHLLEGVADPKAEAAGAALDAAEGGALRAGQIVRRLRELVARGSAALRPEELPKLIEDAGAIAFLDAHLLGVTHRTELDPDVQWVEVDRIQVQQVLINLIRNAMQAMQDAERREILIEAKAVSPHLVQVGVADTGAGISDEVRDALFSPFHGTKSEGMGIGLSICRTIVEAHGGKIWVEDREGGGTVFRFTLPRYDGTLADG